MNQIEKTFQSIQNILDSSTKSAQTNSFISKILDQNHPEIDFQVCTINDSILFNSIVNHFPQLKSLHQVHKFIWSQIVQEERQSASQQNKLRASYQDEYQLAWTKLKLGEHIDNMQNVALMTAIWLQEKGSRNFQHEKQLVEIAKSEIKGDMNLSFKKIYCYINHSLPDTPLFSKLENLYFVIGYYLYSNAQFYMNLVINYLKEKSIFNIDLETTSNAQFYRNQTIIESISKCYFKAQQLNDNQTAIEKQCFQVFLNFLQIFISTEPLSYEETVQNLQQLAQNYFNFGNNDQQLIHHSYLLLNYLKYLKSKNIDVDKILEILLKKNENVDDIELKKQISDLFFDQARCSQVVCSILLKNFVSVQNDNIFEILTVLNPRQKEEMIHSLCQSNLFNEFSLSTKINILSRFGLNNITSYIENMIIADIASDISKLDSKDFQQIEKELLNLINVCGILKIFKLWINFQVRYQQEPIFDIASLCQEIVETLCSVEIYEMLRSLSALNKFFSLFYSSLAEIYLKLEQQLQQNNRDDYRFETIKKTISSFMYKDLFSHKSVAKQWSLIIAYNRPLILELLNLN